MFLFRHKSLSICFLAAAIVLFSSCGSRALLDSTVKLNNYWYKLDAAGFNTEVTDTVSNYNFYLNVRHSTHYRFSNLYLFLETRFPNGNSTRDTLELVLANAEGKWLGKGWGDLREDHILLKKNLRFPLKGPYRFMIWQAMRRDTLKGIYDVGIQIIRVK